MKKLQILFIIIIIFSLSLIHAIGAENPVPYERDSFKESAAKKSIQEYSFYDVCTRLDKIIEMLGKIIDQNERTIGIIRENNGSQKILERLNSLDSQNKKIMESLGVKTR